MEMFSLGSLLCIILGMIFFSSISHYSKKIHLFPEVIWMLLFGIIYGLVQKNFGDLWLPAFMLESWVILYIFVPLLIFASSQKICLFQFRKVLFQTSILASLGVLISMFSVAFILYTFCNLPFMACLLFWTIISATDPLAVWAILSKNKQIPESKKTLIEWESILNDGCVVTIFGILGLILFDGHSFELIRSSYEFLYHIWVAVLVGVIFGRGIRWVLKKWKEEYFTLSINMTLLLAFSSFALAEVLHSSGIIAVFIAALSYGYMPDEKNHNREIHENIWEYIEYLANSILFFLLGAAFISQTDFSAFNVIVVLIAFAVLLLARGMALWLLLPWLSLEKEKFTFFDFLLLHLSGSRGAVSVALILLLPDSFEQKDFFLSLAFLIIILSLVVNPLILQWLLKKKGAKKLL